MTNSQTYLSSSQPRVAIMVPTMNRPDFVRRLLGYYKSINSIHPLFIGDSSEASSCSAYTDLISDSSLSLYYYHLPRHNIQQALGYLAQQVHSLGFEYISLHGDDDYFVPSTLSECAEFLSLNPDYMSAHGRAATVSLASSGPYGKSFTVGTYWELPTIRETSPLARAKEFLRSYYVTQFSVHRTSTYLDTCTFYQSIPDQNWGEISQCLLLAMAGRSKAFDTLYLVRTVHPGIIHPHYIKWILTPSFSQGLKDLLSYIHIKYSFTSTDMTSLAESFSDYFVRTIQLKAHQNKLPPFLTPYFKSLKPVLSYTKKIYKILFANTRDMSLLFHRRSRFYRLFKPIILSFKPQP